jgi:Cdc6-like AAA superfamily ATPase
MIVGNYIAPYRRCPHFVGREDCLQKLYAAFQPRGRNFIPLQREYLLYGLGGSGKTQICLQFVEENSHMYVSPSNRHVAADA